MFKKGFTLIEILIAMALVGIIVAVLTPNIAKVMPDKKKALFIKAFTRTEMAVSNMINDPEMYPAKYNITVEEGTNPYTVFGLCSDGDVTGLLKINNDFREHGSLDTEYKFHYYFAQELGSNYVSTNNGNIPTNDGLNYYIKREETGDAEPRSQKAATITVEFGSADDNDIGKILVLNDGTVSCSPEKINGNQNNPCSSYLNDRFDLKQKDSDED